jgi:hypothetical protein
MDPSIENHLIVKILILMTTVYEVIVRTISGLQSFYCKTAAKYEVLVQKVTSCQGHSRAL